MDRVFMLSYIIALPSGITSTLFYWAVLYDPHDKEGDDHLSFSNVMKHGAVYLPLLVDLTLSRVPVVSYHYSVRRWGWWEGHVGSKWEGREEEVWWDGKGALLGRALFERLW